MNISNDDDDEMVEITMKDFISHITDLFEAQSNAITELYENQKEINRSLSLLSDRNEKLIDMIMRCGNEGMN